LVEGLFGFLPGAADVFGEALVILLLEQLAHGVAQHHEIRVLVEHIAYFVVVVLHKSKHLLLELPVFAFGREFFALSFLERAVGGLDVVHKAVTGL